MTPEELWRPSPPVPFIPRPPKPEPRAPAGTPELGVLRSALAAIPNEGDKSLDYDLWRSVIFGIHFATGGSDEGLALAHEFSARSPKHEPGFLDERVWPYIQTERGGDLITERSLFRMAEECGWTDPSILDDFEVLPLEEPGEPDPPRKRGLRLEPFDEVEPDLDRPHLVRDILHPGAFAVMFGPPNEGKSFAALDMTLAIARGEPWLGHETTAGPVVYAALEGGGGMRTRFKGYRRHYDLEGQDVPLFLLPESLNLRRKEDVVALVDALNDVQERTGQGVALLVIDTLSRALAGGDENSSVDMGTLVAAVDHIRAKTGAGVLVLHHVPRDAMRPRGHGSLDAAADTMLKVEKAGPVGRVTITKQRDLAYAPPIGFRLLPVNVGMTAAGEVVTSCIVERADAPSSGKSLKAGGQHERALSVLSRLTAEQGKPQAGAIVSVPMVALDTWKAACFGEVFAHLSGNELRASFNRVKRELGTKGYITEYQEFCGVMPQ